jgi:hypothetical protein
MQPSRFRAAEPPAGEKSRHGLLREFLAAVDQDRTICGLAPRLREPVDVNWITGSFAGSAEER